MINIGKNFDRPQRFLIHAIGIIAKTLILPSDCVGALRSKDLRSIIFYFSKMIYNNLMGRVDLSSEVLTL